MYLELVLRGTGSRKARMPKRLFDLKKRICEPAQRFGVDSFNDFHSNPLWD